MAKHLADLILGARRRSNTERSGFVSDPEVGGYVQDGIKAAYDRILAADESSYQATPLDFSFSGVTEAGATAALPVDFYKVRGFTQFPDSPRSRPIFPIAYSDRQRKAGYYLSGTNGITISPYYAAPRGPWRLVYSPKPPSLGVAIPVKASTDGVVASTSVFTFSTGYFDQAVNYVGGQLMVDGCANIGNNSAWRDGWTISAATATTITVSGATLTNETFGPNVRAWVLKPAQAGPQPAARVADVPRLDTILDQFDDVVELWGALAIAQKQRQADKAATLDVLLNGDGDQKKGAFNRIDSMAADRQSEPQAAPTLWSPSYDPVNGFGWGGGNGWID